MFEDPAALSDAELDERLVALAGQRHALDALLVATVGESVRRGRHEQAGVHTASEFVSWRAGFAKREADQLIRLARVLPEFPSLAAAMANGQVSSSVAVQAVKVATPENEAALCEVLIGATPAQVARIVTEYRKQLPPPPDPPDDAAERSFESRHYDDDGTLCGRYEVPADQAGVVDQAFQAARDELIAGGDPDPTGGEVVFELARHYLDGRHDHVDTRGGAYHTLITVDVDTLLGLSEGAAVTEHGLALDRTSLEVMLCDGTCEFLIQHRNNPLFLGHTQRFATPQQRRVLRQRDKGCRVCGRRNRYLHAHHVTPWPSGTTDIDQMLLLCRRHHRAAHRGHLVITATGPGQFRFSLPDGTPLATGPPRHAPPSAEPRPVPTNAATPAWGGERLNRWALNTILESLLAAARPDAA